MIEQPEWRKSSRSTANGGACVEVATNINGVVYVRDSKDPDGPMLSVHPDEWRSFLSSVHGRSRPSSA